MSPGSKPMTGPTQTCVWRIRPWLSDTKAKSKKGHEGPNPDPGPISKLGPTRTVDGSFLAFRRLQQDVPAFQQNIKNLAAQLKISEDLVGAKIVGRYKSGCPIELRWQKDYAAMMKQLERDFPELLNFYYMPKPLWRSLRTTNVIERCFVDVRRRTRPMVTFVNIQSVDRIILVIFNRFSQEWKNRSLKNFTQAA
jgi:Transposase, Mutator family